MDKLYRDLVDLPGAPSFEKPVRDYMRAHLTPNVEEIIEDRLGSIFGVINKGSNGPKVMIAGHMDEVGAVVTGIDKLGLIEISSLGSLAATTVTCESPVIEKVPIDEVVETSVTSRRHNDGCLKPSRFVYLF